MENNEMYRKRKCELCGKFAFEKYLGTVSVLDGGYTRNEKFEESGFGSLVITYWGIKNVKHKRFEVALCPECAKKIDDNFHAVLEELSKQ